jgi:flagellar hook-associated protein 2
MSDPIRIGGFYSSFDTESVISRLTEARSIVLRRLDVQEAKAEAQKAALADLQTRFASLLGKTNLLAEATSVSGKTATVAGMGVSASAAPSSTAGSFTVDVLALATGTKVNGVAISAGVTSSALLQDSNLSIPVSAGTFTIKTASGGSATITVDPATQTLDDVVAAINASGVGITATIENDANGRPNLLRLDSTQGTITLGTGADTSNFLTATNLIASSGTTTRQSTLGIARMSTSDTMAEAAWAAGAPAAGDHSFSINGVTIAYNAATDSLARVIERINASGAGVTARYDAATDSVKLQQNKTGSIEMTLADDGTGGDLLAKLGLLGAPQELGTNAAYSLDGGPTQYSATNSISYNGVSVTLNAVTTAGSPATVTVAADTGLSSATVKSFVTEFNLVLKSIRSVTKADQDSSKSGMLSGDSSIRALESSLRSMVTSAGLNLSGTFRTLSEIGISFGAPGAALGSTNELQFDEAKFKAALERDPGSVQSLLSEITLTPTLDPGGTGSIASMSGSYAGNKAGTYAITDDGSGNLTAVFTPRDGSASTTTTATVVAGGTTDTLIPGMTLQLGAALQAGTHTITVSPGSQSVVQQVRSFLEALAGTDGTFVKRQDAYDKRIDDLVKRKDQIQASIDAEMAVLRQKFAAMEQAQMRAQSVLQALQQAATSIAAQNKSN